MRVRRSFNRQFPFRSFRSSSIAGIGARYAVFLPRRRAKRLTSHSTAHYACALMVPGDGIKRERSGGFRASSLRLPPQL